MDLASTLYWPDTTVDSVHRAVDREHQISKFSFILQRLWFHGILWYPTTHKFHSSNPCTCSWYIYKTSGNPSYIQNCLWLSESEHWIAVSSRVLQKWNNFIWGLLFSAIIIKLCTSDFSQGKEDSTASDEVQITHGRQIISIWSQCGFHSCTRCILFLRDANLYLSFCSAKYFYAVFTMLYCVLYTV